MAARIKWTADSHETLLLKILEVHEGKLNYDRIVEAWPPDHDGRRPTGTAIKRHLEKLRDKAKSTGQIGHFAVGASGASGITASGRSVKGTARQASTSAASRGRRAGAGGGAAPGRTGADDQPFAWKSAVEDENEEKKKMDDMDMKGLFAPAAGGQASITTPHKASNATQLFGGLATPSTSHRLSNDSKSNNRKRSFALFEQECNSNDHDHNHDHDPESVDSFQHRKQQQDTRPTSTLTQHRSLRKLKDPTTVTHDEDEDALANVCPIEGCPRHHMAFENHNALQYHMDRYHSA